MGDRFGMGNSVLQVPTFFDDGGDERNVVVGGRGVPSVTHFPSGVVGDAPGDDEEQPPDGRDDDEERRHVSRRALRPPRVARFIRTDR
jgi:hypothetical protein